jgi:competence protein ComEC
MDATTTPAPSRHAATSSRHAAPPNYQPLVVVFVAVAAGIVVDRAWPVLPAAWLAAALAGCGLWLPLWLRGWNRLAAVALLAAAAATGGAWHHLRWYTFPDDDLVEFADDEPQPIAARVVADGEPRRLPAAPFDPLRAIPSGDNSRLEVQLIAVRDGQDWRPASGRAALVVHGHLLDIQAGDELEVLGQASRMHPPNNPGGTHFAAHHRADRLLCNLRANSPEAVTVIRRGSPWSIARALDAMRGHGEAMLTKYVHHDRSGFAAALLLNQREQLDYQRTEAFLQTNTIHYLAISGMHVAILAGTLFLALRWGFLPRRWALLAVAVSATLYVVLTGSPPSAVRSLVLVLLVCLASLVGRPTSAFNCLAAAGIFVVALNPADFFRVGAQLSFLAVGTLAWFGPKWLAWQERDALERLVARSRPWLLRLWIWKWRWTFRVTAVTAAVWLVTLPLIMARFHLLSPVAILLSPLLWLPIGLAMMSGFGVMMFGWLLPPLGWACGLLCDVSLGAIDWLVLTASQLPASHFWVAGPDDWWLAGLYAGLALWAAFPQWAPRRRWGLAALAAWTAVGLGDAWLDGRRGDRLECTFISVGHGCSVLLELPDGQTILYDAGQLGSPAAGARNIAGCLWWRGITHLDAVVISHADVDHYNALPLLLKQFSVGRVCVSPLMFREDRDERESLAVRALGQAIDRAGVPIEIIRAGDVIPAQGCELRVLHPPPEGVPPKNQRDDRDNANSLVLAIEYAGRRMLLPGDLEKTGIDRLLAQPPLDCDVLLAPHHGSAQSNPTGFAAWSTPEWVIVSGGHDASPALFSAYEGRGASVLHTARDGAVRVRIERDSVALWHWHHGEFRPILP